MTGAGDPSGSNSKVSKVIGKYGLVGVGDKLERYWTADGDERKSLRDLADYFNRELLGTALDDHGVDTLEGEVDNLYRLLTDDEVTSGVRTEAENRLEEHGIDVDELTADFVSRQAVHTYLKKDREAEYTTDDDDDVLDRRMGELQRLKSRLSAVAERTLSTLADSGHVTLGDFQVLVSVRVQCTDCGSQYGVTDLVSRGGCQCQTER